LRNNPHDWNKLHCPLAEGKEILQPCVVVELGKVQLTLQVGRYPLEIIEFLMMMEVFHVVVLCKNHARKLSFPFWSGINIFCNILLVRIFLGFTLVFLLTSRLLR
jgi:hypothetical protein